MLALAPNDTYFNLSLLSYYTSIRHVAVNTQKIYTGTEKETGLNSLTLTVSKILKHCNIHPEGSPGSVTSVHATVAAESSCAVRTLVSQEPQDKADST